MESHGCGLECYNVHNPPTDTREQQNTYQHLYTQPCTQTSRHTLPHLPTPLNYTLTPTDHSSSTHTILQHNTTLLSHHAPQLIANPARNPLRVHFIIQSHVQITESIIAPQTGRNGAGELIAVEDPDETARGSLVVGAWCTAMMHACLGCEVCWNPIVVAK